MKWYLQALRKYAVFAGRARRKEWWTFGLIYLVILFALKGIDLLAGTYDQDSRYGLFSGLYVITTFVPVVTVSVRRLHDTNRSGWWYLIIFIPLVGIILLEPTSLILSRTASNRGKRKVGKSLSSSR
jgi:uncharacterized membrane protein YhaH (DUF805 family)